MIRALIVEDDPMVAKFNSKYLEQVGGFEVVRVVGSVEEAMEALETIDVQLILLDVYMPGRTGLELLTWLRTMNKAIDVIVVSAACDRKSINTALQYGAVDYLIKPFEFERFNTALSAYRERTSFMGEREKFNQAEVDKHIFKKAQTAPSVEELPKGVDKNTLIRVWEAILAQTEKPFSTEEMAKLVGVSRVSMRKYLPFLCEIGVLKQEIDYRTVGRPAYKYKCLNPDRQFLERYQ